MLKVTLKDTVTDDSLKKLNEFRFALTGNETGAISFSTKSIADFVTLEILSGDANFYKDQAATQLVGKTFVSSAVNTTAYIKFSSETVVRLHDYMNLRRLGFNSTNPFYKGGTSAMKLDASELKYTSTLNTFMLFDLYGSYGNIDSWSGNAINTLNLGNSAFTGSFTPLVANSKDTLVSMNLRRSQVELKLSDLSTCTVITFLNTSTKTSGDLKDLPSQMVDIFFNDTPTSLTYTGTSAKWANLDRLIIEGYALPTAQFKNLILHCAALAWSGPFKTLTLKGTVGGDTQIQNAIASMQAKGVVVTINA